ncbi:hypothetical protein KGQ27_02890 [Patescibacteria group bacterium]|nr:hypothetical protein [Patescibacteria group bacterium]MDE1946815.1 hypothetical protein [Patescibacteria group bacterium]MDE2011153.1 hypothetical protein [Patescibacteria group bacterium]MDE2233062.1 hypothetical protein [Patescibacteria group bacterium]
MMSILSESLSRIRKAMTDGKHPALFEVKIKTIYRLRKRYGTEIFIETGTYLGDTLNRAKDMFASVISIELDTDLFIAAQRRFAQYRNVRLYKGDSGVILPTVINELVEPALFWLDGHYSGGITARGQIDTPIVKELQAIMSHPVRRHVILIDDARLFDGTNNYPVQKAVFELATKNGYRSSIKDDMITIIPK